jgi:urease accessory protein
MSAMQPDATRLLALLQVSDSFFPSAAYTHSFGLAQLTADGRVRTSEGVAKFARSVLALGLATSDAVVAAEACRRAADGDVEGAIALDRALYAMKAPSELRRAAAETGRRTLEELAGHVSTPAFDGFLAEVRAGRAPGTHAAALGVSLASFGISPEATAAALLFGGVNAMLQAGLRLLPLSHRDAQATLHELRPLIAELARAAAAPGRADALAAFHPMQEIASMRHRGAEARMFAS